MTDRITYYKVIGSDNKSCHGGAFDWTPYLPKRGMPGKWTPEIDDIKKCERGYHITRYWNMWYKEGCRIFECDFDGLMESSDPGVIEKEAARRIRLVREIKPRFTRKCNTGNFNTGERNSGNCNTGNFNTGNFNTGNRNSGNFNTGSRNTGSWNTGHWNIGERNSGNFNTGHWNTGHWNTGERNTGHWNSGHWNTGHWNSGHWNSGSRNTGHWNACNNSTGFFNTVTPDTVMVFNKPCKVDVWEKAKKPDFIFFEIAGAYKEAWRKAYDGASVSDKLLLVQLPNFDADVFHDISGIRVDPASGLEVPPSKQGTHSEPA